MVSIPKAAGNPTWGSLPTVQTSPEFAAATAKLVNSSYSLPYIPVPPTF